MFYNFWNKSWKTNYQEEGVVNNVKSSSSSLSLAPQAGIDRRKARIQWMLNRINDEMNESVSERIYGYMHWIKRKTALSLSSCIKFRLIASKYPEIEQISCFCEPYFLLLCVLIFYTSHNCVFPILECRILYRDTWKQKQSGWESFKLYPGLRKPQCEMI